MYCIRLFMCLSRDVCLALMPCPHALHSDLVLVQFQPNAWLCRADMCSWVGLIHVQVVELMADEQGWDRARRESETISARHYLSSFLAPVDLPSSQASPAMPQTAGG